MYSTLDLSLMKAAGAFSLPSLLSHCQASLPAPTLRFPAERALLVNASELEMSHSTSSRGWSILRWAPSTRERKNIVFFARLTFSGAIMKEVLKRLWGMSKCVHWVRHTVVRWTVGRVVWLCIAWLTVGFCKKNRVFFDTHCILKMCF